MKKIILFIMLCVSIIQAQPEFTDPGTAAFSRLGFGARSIGMGNAVSAVNTGNLTGYNNPALSVFQEGNSFQTAYSFLSLDRSLNFLSFTRKFDFYSSKDTAADRKPRSTAGLSAGIINAGVSDIDEYDNSGFNTGNVSTSENLGFIALSNRFSQKLAIGIGIKIYYYKLYDKVTSSGFGLDFGALYRVNDQFNISLMIANLNSKYKWDSAPIYESAGSNYEEKIPLLTKAGLSYYNPDIKLLASAEFESSEAGANIIRVGAEYNIIENLYVRGGIDNWAINNPDMPVRPAAGFSYAKMFGSMLIGVDYAFMSEQYSPSDRHIVGVSLTF